jgi:glycosyltransferase involved in cell wall biosynthesis
MTNFKNDNVEFLKSQLKILIISQYFHPEVFRINEVARSLADRKNEVYVLTGIPNYPSGKIYKGYKKFFNIERWNGVLIYRLPIIPRGSGSALFLFLNYISFVLMGMLFAPIIFCRHKLDLIYIYGTSPIFQALPGLLIAKIKGVKCILNVQDIWPESISMTGYIKNEITLQFIRKLVDKIYIASDLIVAQSLSIKQKIAQVTSPEKCFFIPNSVGFIDGTNSSQIIDFKILNEFEKNKINILYAGNIGKAQGLNVLLEAALLLKEDRSIKFLIAGDGSELEKIKKMCMQHKLENIVFLGKFPNDVMPILYAHASFLFIALKKHYALSMTIPNKLQVYLSMGKPIIGSIDGEASRIIVESRSGLVAPAGDSKQLANIITEAASLGGDKISTMGINGKNYFKDNFNNDLVINSLITLMKNCLNEKI